MGGPATDMSAPGKPGLVGPLAEDAGAGGVGAPGAPAVGTGALSAAALERRSAVSSAARCSVEKEIFVVLRPMSDDRPSLFCGSFLTVMEKSLVSVPVQVASSRSFAYVHSLVTSKVMGLSVSAARSQMQKMRGYFPFHEFLVQRKRRMYVIPCERLSGTAGSSSSSPSDGPLMGSIAHGADVPFAENSRLPRTLYTMMKPEGDEHASFYMLLLPCHCLHDMYMLHVHVHATCTCTLP